MSEKIFEINLEGRPATMYRQTVLTMKGVHPFIAVERVGGKIMIDGSNDQINDEIWQSALLAAKLLVNADAKN